MATPTTAKAFPQALAPKDRVEFYVYLNQGAPDASPAPLLLLGEAVDSYSLALTAEAIAVGLQILTGSGRDNALTGNELRLWLGVDPSMVGSSLFQGVGVTVGIEVSVVTTAVPARTKDRTFLVRIANQ